MHTSFHFIPLHSLPSNKPFPSSRVPPTGAHHHVRAPPPHEIIEMAHQWVPNSHRTAPCGLLVLVIFCLLVPSFSSDVQALLKFKGSLRNGDAALSNWNAATPPCNGGHEAWRGVMCENSNIFGLKLENMGLEGDINVDALSEMRDLRALSVMNNNFDGDLPNIKKLGALKTIYLSNNQFSGEIPADLFKGMSSLKKIYLSNNSFSGTIPSSLTTLHKLMELKLDNNKFEGQIPSFPRDKFKVFDVSNNRLSGEIPSALSHLDASAFNGNKDLCGAPLQSCSSPPNSPPNSPAKLSVATKVIISIVVIVAVAALIAAAFFILRRRKQTADPSQAADIDRMEQGQVASASSSPDNHPGAGKKSEPSVKLTFLNEGRDKFDMTDLLKASAEIIGGGVFGSAYKAALSDGRVMFVKRFRNMNNVTKEEFHEHMRRLGRLDHPNLLPLVAFYYRKEEKLLVTDFVPNASLAVHLHGNKSQNLPTPDWPTRLNIVKGVARGLKYLYNELPSLTAPHGHLKSSNILLDNSFNPLFTDYGLVPVVNEDHAHELMACYKSPEYNETGRITRKTDIWNLGILILEIITGRSPSNFLQHETDLTIWIKSVANDSNNNNKVFDGDMEGMNHCQGEMMKLLKIGLNCCQVDEDKRPDIREVVEKIEEIKEKDTVDDDFFSSYTSETDMRSSRGLSDDFNNVTFH